MPQRPLKSLLIYNPCSSVFFSRSQTPFGKRSNEAKRRSCLHTTLRVVRHRMPLNEFSHRIWEPKRNGSTRSVAEGIPKRSLGTRNEFSHRIWEPKRNGSTRSVEEGIPKRSLGTRKNLNIKYYHVFRRFLRCLGFLLR